MEQETFSNKHPIIPKGITRKHKRKRKLEFGNVANDRLKLFALAKKANIFLI